MKEIHTVLLQKQGSVLCDSQRGICRPVIRVMIWWGKNCAVFRETWSDGDLIPDFPPAMVG